YSSGTMSPAKCPAEKSPGAPLGMALAANHSRAAARKAASSGVSSKSTTQQVRTEVERVLVLGELLGDGRLAHVGAGAASAVLLVDRVQEPLDPLDHASGAVRREHVKGMLGTAHLRVQHRRAGDLPQPSHERAGVSDRSKRVEVAVDHEEGWCVLAHAVER